MSEKELKPAGNVIGCDQLIGATVLAETSEEHYFHVVLNNSFENMIVKMKDALRAEVESNPGKNLKIQVRCRMEEPI